MNTQDAAIKAYHFHKEMHDIYYEVIPEPDGWFLVHTVPRLEQLGYNQTRDYFCKQKAKQELEKKRRESSLIQEMMERIIPEEF